MNRFENWFCASPLWRHITHRHLLPWFLEGTNLGEHVLEVGAGPGAATSELARRAARVTSLEYSHKFAVALYANGAGPHAVQGDASVLPFQTHTFTSAVAILVLHHLRSAELQDRAFAEIYRVLKPGGVFLAFEIPNGWLTRVAHIKSTFVPVPPITATARLNAVGFSSVTANTLHRGFRIRAVRAKTS
jgi:ubiquinone/menaquinone biosynthesis C-methylase UbiE